MSNSDIILSIALRMQMLDILIFFILGVWIGYISRIFYRKELTESVRTMVSIAFAVVALLLLVLMEIPPNVMGIWAAGALFGFYYALGFDESRIDKLSDSWAGLWLMILFFAMIYGRSVLIPLFQSKMVN